jgi:hypothetical protein
MRRRQPLARLQQAQQQSRFYSAAGGERRRLYAAVQPDDRLAVIALGH